MFNSVKIEFVLLFVNHFIINSFCYMDRTTSNVCQGDYECPANAYCQFIPDIEKGHCSCNPGFFLASRNGTRNCYMLVDYQGVCYFDDQCQHKLSSDSSCQKGKCLCNEDSHYVETTNTCYKSSKLGERCRTPKNCIENTACVDGYCSCQFGQHVDSNTASCVKNIELEEACNIDEECVTENARCHNTCKCKTSHIALGQKCIPVAAQLNEDCEIDQQCTLNIPNSVCYHSSCSCRKNFHAINYKCHPNINLHEICEKDQQCHVPNSFCMGRCICQPEFHERRGSCISSSSHLHIKSVIVIPLALIFLQILQKCKMYI